MKKCLLNCLATVISLTLFAQQPSVKWQAEIGPRKVFIENQSQFNGKNLLAGQKILFGTDRAPVAIYFTREGLTYRLDKKEKRQKTDLEEQINHMLPEERQEDKDKDDFITVSDVVHMQWVNANPDVQIVSEGEESAYYSYVLDQKNITNVKAYRKLIYKNLYPGIDVEYVFHAKEGIEYSLILHPGADISMVKMAYSGTNLSGPQSGEASADKAGNIHLSTLFGDIIDHAPHTFYAGDNGAPVSSNFELTGKTVFFHLGNYDHTKTLIVDPWTTTPSLPNSNKAFYVKSDSSGNAYVYGGDSPFQLLKYNSSGTLQWTYATPWDSSQHWFGALATDRAGNSYITNGDGGTLAKVSPAGALVWSKNSSNEPILSMEFWSMDFNCDQTELFIGGMRGPFALFPPGTWYGAIYHMNLTNGSISSYKEVALESPGFIINNINEVRSMCMSPNGNLYFLTLDTIGSITQSLSINYRQMHSYNFDYYLPYSAGGNGQGSNNIRATSQFLYTTDGVTLDKRDISTGNILNTVTIPGGSAQLNSGVAIDTCGNVYVGSQNAVVKYDANLSQLSTASTSGAVYDVSIGINGDVLACGRGFAAALAMSACPQVRSICYTSLSANINPINATCGQCNGSATASATNGTGPYSYAWSGGGQTTQTATGLCAGTYTVTITDQSNSNTATASSTITQPSGITASASPTAATCGSSNGSATATVTAGTGPFTYSWSNTGSSQTISNLAAGTYTVTVSGSGGCSTTASAVVTGGSNLTLSAAPTATTCGSNNGSATVNITAGTGPYTYSWSPAVNGSTTATISNAAAGTYDVTVTGSGGCSATASAAISGSTGLSLSAIPTGTTCASGNGSATVNVTAGTGPYTYSWSPVVTGSNTATISNATAGTYLVTVTGSGSCSATASALISSSTGVAFTTSTTNAGCTSTGTASINLTSGSAPFTYLWNNGDSASIASNLSGGTYTVTVTGAGCSATGSATVTSSGGGLGLSQASNSATCGSANGSASISVTSGTGPFTYAWSNSGSSSSISNVATGNYTVTVTGAGGCSATASVSVSAVSNMSISAQPSATRCGGANGSATVSITVGTGPYTYSWSPTVNGSSTATISNAAAGNYNVTVTGSGGCSATASTTISSSSALALSTSSTNTSCGRNNGSASVSPTNGSSPFTYAWSDTLSTATIANVASGTYTVTVTDANGCTATGTATINPSGNTPVTIQENKSIMCSGDSALICAPSGYATYAWNDGDNNSCFETTLPGNYYVTVTDNGGCTASSNSLNLAIYPQTPVVLTVSGDTLHAYYGVTYQWYFDNAILPGDTNAVLVATQAGQYYVVEKDTSGCIITSTAQNIKGISGIEQLSTSDEILVYPNPLSFGGWHLQVSQVWLGAWCDIYDAAGRLVFRSEVKNLNSEIELNVAQGVYVMRIYSEQKSYNFKLIRL